eukprot:TRINITY_DN7086_c0_g2_i1.p1 TRINITY_DN7086_c0_g2~~TRINITY_DN7086_c0_g2_i1.p1  ORF type:complete len:343 (+),score=55.47 TRINITY_DN7086_c0_g2_i1:959-1987(+)
MEWKDYFEHPFVRMEQKEYAIQLESSKQLLYLEENTCEEVSNSHSNNRLSTEDTDIIIPKEKNKLFDIEASDAFPAEEYELLMAEETKPLLPNTLGDIPLTSGSGTLTNSRLLEFYRNTSDVFLRRAEILADYLTQDAEKFPTKSHEKIQFLILINVLSRVRALILTASPNNLTLLIKRNQGPAVMSIEGGKCTVITLISEHLKFLRENKEIQKRRMELSKVYVGLIEFLKKSAFLIIHVTELESLSNAVDGIIETIEQLHDEDEANNWVLVRKRLVQATMLLEVIIEEYCMHGKGVEEALRKNWCRFIVSHKEEKEREKKSVEHLIVLQKLLRLKIESLHD